MKNILLIAGVAIGLASCTTEQPTLGRLNTTDGFYSADFHSASQAGWAGGNTSDTIIPDFCYLAFDYGQVFTINRDSVVTPLPLLGFNFTNTFEFPTSLNDTALQVGTETWYYGVIDNEIHLTRVTDYFGMGMDIQTLILTEL
tara:strand:+ start:37 stop:465 length:429 start_codon:yes stop_codon:yes gene_type:complete